MLSSLVSLELSVFDLAKQDENMAFSGNCNRRLQHHAHKSVLNGLVDPCAYYVIYCQGLKQKTCWICSLSYNKNTVGYARKNVPYILAHKTHRDFYIRNFRKKIMTI